MKKQQEELEVLEKYINDIPLMIKKRGLFLYSAYNF